MTGRVTQWSRPEEGDNQGGDRQNKRGTLAHLSDLPFADVRLAYDRSPGTSTAFAVSEAFALDRVGVMGAQWRAP